MDKIQYHPLNEGLFSHLAVHTRTGMCELKVDRDTVTFGMETAQRLHGLLAGYLEDEKRRRDGWRELMNAGTTAGTREG